MWGNATFAPDDIFGYAQSHGELVVFRPSVVETEGKYSLLKNMTASEAGTWILERTPTHFQVSPPSLYRAHLDPRSLRK